MTTSDHTLPNGEVWRDIEHLKGSHYQIADGEPDIRGWKVRSRDGRVIGKVEDLLINKRHRLAEYIEVDLDGDDDRRIVLPIRDAVLHAGDDEVQFIGVTDPMGVGVPEEPSQATKDLQRDLNRFFGSRRAGRDPENYLVDRSTGP